MVIRQTKRSRRKASLLIELIAAMTIVVGVLIPLAWSLHAERRLVRSLYQRAVAMEIVDGELEVLLAGEWKAQKPGTQPYMVRANSATNLPQGNFLLTLETNYVRLEWRPEVKHHGGSVIREGRIL